MFSRSIVASLALLVASVSAKERFNEIKVSKLAEEMISSSVIFIRIRVDDSFILIWHQSFPFLYYSMCIS